MSPLRRTQVLTALVLGTALLLVPSAFIGYEATIGGVWSHNTALDACGMRATANSAYEKAEIGVRDRWTWWLPGHSHVCVYDLPGGRTITRPVPVFR